MTIKEQLINAYEQQIAQIRLIEEREIDAVKQKVMRDKVIPFNQEIDQSRAKAENELAQILNSNISNLQSQFAKDKKDLFDAGEKKKADYLASIMATETYAITSECEKSISKLNAQIEELKG